MRDLGTNDKIVLKWI